MNIPFIKTLLHSRRNLRFLLCDSYIFNAAHGFIRIFYFALIYKMRLIRKVICDNIMWNNIEGRVDIMEERLQKYVAECGLMSRRAAEKEIELGNITVNGEKVEVGRKIIPGRDKVVYKGRPVVMEKDDEKLYILLNKPRGYVTTMSDEKGRKCLPELLAGVPGRVYPCGRLDMDSEGLVILTNDGDAAAALMHPKHDVEKIYHVKIKKEVTQEELSALNSPMEIDGYKLRPVKVSIMSRKDGETVLRFVLTEGRNRQIRKMCDKVGLRVARLRRISIGELNIGVLPVGKWKYMNHGEKEWMKSLYGEKNEV